MKFDSTFFWDHLLEIVIGSGAVLIFLLITIVGSMPEPEEDAAPLENEEKFLQRTLEGVYLARKESADYKKIEAKLKPLVKRCQNALNEGKGQEVQLQSDISLPLAFIGNSKEGPPRQEFTYDYRGDSNITEEFRQEIKARISQRENKTVEIYDTKIHFNADSANPYPLQFQMIPETSSLEDAKAFVFVETSSEKIGEYQFGGDRMKWTATVGIVDVRNGKLLARRIFTKSDPFQYSVETRNNQFEVNGRRISGSTSKSTKGNAQQDTRDLAWDWFAVVSGYEVSHGIMGRVSFRRTEASQ